MIWVAGSVIPDKELCAGKFLQTVSTLLVHDLQDIRYSIWWANRKSTESFIIDTTLTHLSYNGFITSE